MGQGDNKQLMVAGGGAIVVLALGAVAYFAASEPSKQIAPPVNAATRTLSPDAPLSSVRTPGPPSGAGTPKRAPLNSNVREPRVRPTDLTAAVESGLRVGHEAMSTCYATELAARPAAKGRAILQFSIADHAVVGLKTELRGLPSMDFKSCVEQVVQALRFADVSAPASVNWPLVMWPDKGLEIQAPGATE